MKNPSRKRKLHLPSPIDLRFIDLFMIIVAALIFMVLSLSFISALETKERAEAPKIITSSLPAAIQDMPYRLTLACHGGLGPYSWNIVKGALPQGLNLDKETGRIVGTPVAEESMSFTVSITDTSNASAQKELVLQVKKHNPTGEALRTTGPVIGLPEAITFVPYVFQFRAAGGEPPYSWKPVNGALPPNFQLTSEGQLAGTLDLSEMDDRLFTPFTFSVIVTDKSENSVTQDAVMTLKYKPAPAWYRTLFSKVGAVISRFFLLLWLVIKWVVLPVLAINLAVVIGLTLLGFKGGTAYASEGLIRQLRESRFNS